MSAKEAAEVLGVNVAALKSRLLRASLIGHYPALFTMWPIIGANYDVQ
jgi:hypothetical protein